jgi:predicted Zn-dependent protease
VPAAPAVEPRMPSYAEFAALMGGEVEPDDPQAREVEKIGSLLVSSSGAKTANCEFHFHVVRDAKYAQACAFPDGQVLITRALLERLKNESELAGVLGHECGHILANHFSIAAAQWRLSLSILAATASHDQSHSISRETLAAMRAKAKDLESQRRQSETSADLLSLQFMSDAGYDPRGMDDAMRIFAQILILADYPPELLETHPNPKQRIEDIDRWINRHFPDGVPSHLTEGLPLEHGIPAGSARNPSQTQTTN